VPATCLNLFSTCLNLFSTQSSAVHIWTGKSAKQNSFKTSDCAGNTECLAINATSSSGSLMSSVETRKSNTLSKPGKHESKPPMPTASRFLPRRTTTLVTVPKTSSAGKSRARRELWLSHVRNRTDVHFGWENYDWRTCGIELTCTSAYTTWPQWFKYLRYLVSWKTNKLQLWELLWWRGQLEEARSHVNNRDFRPMLKAWCILMLVLCKSKLFSGFTGFCTHNTSRGRQPR